MANNNQCKFCGSDRIRKDGETRGKTRYECKECGKHFTFGDKREKLDLQTKILIALLYSSKSMKVIEIANYLGVSRVAIYNCIKEVLGRFDEPTTSLQAKKVEPTKMLGEINRIERNYISSVNQDNNKASEWMIFDLSKSSTTLGILLLKKIPRK